MILPTITKDLPYVIHKYSTPKESQFQLSIQTKDDELEFFTFNKQDKIQTINNNPNIGRYFGIQSEDTRTLDWLEFEGITKNEESYNIIDQGNLRVGQQKDHFSELFFDGKLLSDRWVLRKIPNVFDKSVLGDTDEGVLLWKPPRQKPYNQAFSKNAYYENVKCACAIADASAKFHDFAAQEGSEQISKMQGEFIFNNETQTFEGIAAAEGTWTDMFGVQYTYTPEFILHMFNKEKEQVSKNKGTFVSSHHDFTEAATVDISGQVTGVRLGQDPIKHISVNGVYDGPTDLEMGKLGLSYEFKLRSSWNEDFQSWVPFDATILRLSVVRHPACKICWINKVN